MFGMGLKSAYINILKTISLSCTSKILSKKLNNTKVRDFILSSCFLAHSARSKSFTLLKNLSPLFEKVEDCKLEAFMELMCNCLSFDFDFGLSFMYREKEIAGFMCILWQGFCT